MPDGDEATGAAGGSAGAAPGKDGGGSLIKKVGCVFGLVLFFVVALTAISGAATLPSQFLREINGYAVEGGSGSNGGGSVPGGGGPGSTQVTSGRIPAPLKELFNRISGQTGVPAEFIAATSARECGRLWSVDEATLRSWIQNNSLVDSRGCSERHDCANGDCISGPGQFLDSTWGDLRTRVGQLTGSADPNKLRVVDALTGSALYHYDNKQRKFGARAWDDGVITEVARAYCNGGYNTADAPTNACKIEAPPGSGTYVGYGAGILYYTKLYRSGQ